MTSYARGRLVPVLLAVAVLVGAANLGAYAASGRPLLLGHRNRATATTSLATTGRSPTLTLRSAHGAPPLAVSSSKVVKHLNADRVDGKDAAELGAPALTYRLPNGPTSQSLTVPKPGTYLLSVSVTLSAADASGCFLEEISGSSSVDPISLNGTISGGYTTVSGSSIMRVTKKVQDLNFRCFSPIYSTSAYSSTLGLVRLSARHQGRLVERRTH
ncbi:MAG TPA: hypothetical protein VHW64_18340 [Nocardioides sp.]|jgi:hypothetical protein|uniref:hypothetical protein n=1 Tax=Nocardioides sp. TaxID=35761 RepID=UPI002E3406B5|nr:hypothetical protein [Nocardioides sp.]HEX3932661.1 hypothetical protein [Nocardioides sp.]